MQYRKQNSKQHQLRLHNLYKLSPCKLLHSSHQVLVPRPHQQALVPPQRRMQQFRLLRRILRLLRASEHHQRLRLHRSRHQQALVPRPHQMRRRLKPIAVEVYST